MNEIEVKFITEHDVDAIEKISEGVFVYDGVHSHDYFLQYFKRWLNTSNHFIYGLFVAGELVALKCDTIYDGGTTLYPQGVRVSTQHRGKNYFKILNERCQALREQYVLPNFNIERVRIAVSVYDRDVPGLIEQRLTARKMTSVINVRSGFTGTINNIEIPNSFMKNIKSGTNVNIRVVSAQEAFEFSQLNRHLFPMDSLYTDWDAHLLTYDNFMVLSSGGEGNFGRRFLTVTDSHGLESFVICGITPRGHGIALIIDVFTENSFVIAPIVRHIFQMISSIFRSKIPPNHLWLWYPYKLQPEENIHQVTRDIQSNPSFYNLDVVYFQNIDPAMVYHPQPIPL